MTIVKKDLGGNKLYIKPEIPEWYILNNEAEMILSDPAGTEKKNYLKKYLLKQLEEQPVFQVNGRDESCCADFPEEIWLHITERCNLSCRHCLFSCSTASQKELPYDDIETIVEEACSKGTKTFYLTGGEPLFHQDFHRICQLIFEQKDTKLIILTNGILVKNNIDFLKSLPQHRLFLQISFEGNEFFHESIRGKGTYSKLIEALQLLDNTGIKTSLAMTVTNENCNEVAAAIQFAEKYKVENVHYLWLFQEGNAKNEKAPSIDELYRNLTEADLKADSSGITIDNIKTLEAQIFSSPGLKYDLGTAGFTSLAIGPDRTIYPTPAMIGNPKAACGSFTKNNDISDVWSESGIFKYLRNMTVNDIDYLKDNPLKFITGGNDIDHSLSHTGSFSGRDPYLKLKERLVYYLLKKEMDKMNQPVGPAVILKKGDRVEACSDHYNGVSFTHSGCMLSYDELDGKVGTFYSDAAENPNDDILNPVCYDQNLIDHIPDSARIRSYGCGSPVLDASLKNGETLVDLGSGAGVECFIASDLVGRSGTVIGIDMLDKMLTLARKSSEKVSENLGYNNLDFRKGFLENIPVDTASADKVISNCVVNLSKNKPETFSEISRILKNGGKAIISDVVAERPFPVSIHEDPKLVGECIGGALPEARFIALLKNTGFINIRIVKRFLYREIEGYKYYSITVSAEKKSEITKKVIYPGPFAGVVTDDGRYLIRGHEETVIFNDDNISEEQLFEVDDNGTILNSTAENSCGCYTGSSTENSASPGNLTEFHKSGCLYCGADIIYPDETANEACFICNEVKSANAKCRNGHFICDKCHSGDLKEITEMICLASTEKETIPLLEKIRKHSLVPLNGPEHHFIVPGVITAVYRNLGGNITDSDIKTAILRGKDVPGGVCGFWGACGATIGAGIAFSAILSSSPLTPEARKIVQEVVSEIAFSISEIEAARCCRRESLSVLLKVEELSDNLLPLKIRAGESDVCNQFRQNRECPGKLCRFFPKSARLSPFMKLPGL